MSRAESGEPAANDVECGTFSSAAAWRSDSRGTSGTLRTPCSEAGPLDAFTCFTGPFETANSNFRVGSSKGSSRGLCRRKKLGLQCIGPWIGLRENHDALCAPSCSIRIPDKHISTASTSERSKKPAQADSFRQRNRVCLRGVWPKRKVWLGPELLASI